MVRKEYGLRAPIVKKGIGLRAQIVNLEVVDFQNFLAANQSGEKGLIAERVHGPDAEQQGFCHLPAWRLECGS